MKGTFGGIVRDLRGKGWRKERVEGRGVVEEEVGEGESSAGEGGGRGKGVEIGVLEKS